MELPTGPEAEDEALPAGDCCEAVAKSGALDMKEESTARAEKNI